MRLHAPFSPRLLQRVSKPRSPPPNGSKPIATMRSPSAGSPLNVPGTRHNVPNAAIALSMPRTVSSPAASRASGSSACASSSRPKPSSPGANVNDREHSAPKTGAACSRAAPILRSVWEAATTTARDRKELLRTLLEEVIVTMFKAEQRACLTLRWRGGSLTDIDLDLPRQKPAIVRTDEDTIALVRRLAAHYPDAVIAGVLNRQDRKTAYRHRFTANHVGNLRRHWKIPRFEPASTRPEGELLTIKQAAAVLGIATSTVHRWLNDGFIAGEQLTPAAPWRIRLTEDLRARFVDEEPQGYLTMYQAMRLLSVSRQTVLQRVKRGELQGVHVKRGKKKGLRIKAYPLSPRC